MAIPGSPRPAGELAGTPLLFFYFRASHVLAAIGSTAIDMGDAMECALPPADPAHVSLCGSYVLTCRTLVWGPHRAAMTITLANLADTGSR